MGGRRSSLDAGYIAATFLLCCGSKTSQAFVAWFFKLLNRMVEIFIGGNGLSAFPFSSYLCTSFLFCFEIFTVGFLNGLYWSVQDYKDKSRCYECGEGGHLSYECPKNVVRIFPTCISYFQLHIWWHFFLHIFPHGCCFSVGLQCCQFSKTPVKAWRNFNNLAHCLNITSKEVFSSCQPVYATGDVMCPQFGPRILGYRAF